MLLRQAIRQVSGGVSGGVFLEKFTVDCLSGLLFLKRGISYFYTAKESDPLQSATTRNRSGASER